MLYTLSMINLSLNKQLDIIVPNKNRALAVILEQATPKELEALSKDKDLGSVINSLLKASSQNPSSDRTLLELAKNNPTLKDLGNISATLKDLAGAIKSEKNPLPLESTLKNFLLEMKDISEPILKEKFENSGVFLESKLKNAQNPQLELKNLLRELFQNLAKSDLPTAKAINDKIKELLATPTLKEASNSALLEPAKDQILALKQISKEVEGVVQKLSQAIKNGDITNSKSFEPGFSKSDPLFSKETSAIGAKLNLFKDPQKLLSQESVKEIISKDLKAILLRTSEELSASPHTNQTEVQKHIDKLLLQIDYYQLISHLSDSSSLYLPFSWESLEEGNINIKKDKEDKFYCDIDLTLKEYGELKLKLALYEKNQINIHIYSDNAEFKEIIKANISSLRSALIESQITPREIRLFETAKKRSAYEGSSGDIQLGFEVKA